MNLAGRKVLVTGSSGFIGGHLVKRLKEEGAEVIELDLPLDITKWEQVRGVAQNLDMVFHLAAIVYVPFSWEEPRVTYETNVGGTLNMLELCRLHNIDKYVLMSSYVYGIPKYLPIDENHPVEPLSPYARSKRLAEVLCQTYSEDFGIKVAILRPFNIYGEGQKGDFLIPSIIKQILSKGEVVLNDPTPRRDFLHVADATEMCLRASLFEGSGFEIFNMGFGKSYSVSEVAEKAIEVYGQPIRVKYTGKVRKNEIQDVVANIDKAKKLLDFYPQIELEEGLRRCFASQQGGSQ